RISSDGHGSAIPSESAPVPAWAAVQYARMNGPMGRARAALATRRAHRRLRSATPRRRGVRLRRPPASPLFDAGPRLFDPGLGRAGSGAMFVAEATPATAGSSLRSAAMVRVFGLATLATALFASSLGAQRIAEGRPSYAEPGISPDGAEIAFVSGGDIWSVPASGGEARLLVSHPATEARPLFSPDGRFLAFVPDRTGNGDIYVLELATGEVRRLTYDDGRDQLEGWSPDGRWIYFSSASRDIAGMNDVYRVAASGGTPMPVAADRYTNEFFAAAAPDGETVAISARGIASSQWWRRGHSHIDQSEIWLVRIGGVPRYERVTDGVGKELWPMWGADGRTLYYVSDR